MNLLFYVPQMAAYGGIERHVCNLAAAAASRGHSVRLLTTSNSLGAELRATLSGPLISLRELPCARGAAGPLRKMLWLLNEVRRSRASHWDLVYTNGQSALSRIVWLAAGAGTRVVHHHHTAADAGEQSTWSPGFRRVLTRAPKLIGCSRATCNALNHALARTDAVFLPYLTSSPVGAEQIADRPPGSPLRFGFCGRLIPEKGIDTLLALAADDALPDIEWHIHGEGEAYPFARFSGLPRVVYHGAYHSSAEHARALLALDAFVLFSTHNEGMPLGLIEAMSAGLPWIATDRGGTRELALCPSESFVVPARASVPELAAAVRTLAEHIRSGSTSRHAQRAAYDRHFAPAVVAAQWLDFLET